jgi:hypothetical protein
MTRTRAIVMTVIVCALGLSARTSAQTTPIDGWVVLPVDEYRTLRERANAQPPPPPGPAIDATLTRIDYELRIDTESVTGRALLTIDVLRDGWTRMQIPAGLMVREARLGSQPVALIEGPPPHVLLARAGRVVLALDIALPLAASAGSESVTLPASAAPISRATLTLPRTGVELSAAGGFLAAQSQTATESQWTIFGRPNEPLTLSWKRKIDDRRAEQPLRTRARITSVFGLGEDVSQLSAAVRLEVVQGLAREIALSVPQGVTVNQVNGPTIADWNVSDGRLHIRFLDPIATETAFVVQGETRTPRDGSIAVPLLRVPAAERETGGVAVDVVGAGEIADRQSRGLEQADATDLGEIVSGRESPSMAAFRLRPLAGSEPRSLSVTVVRYTPQAVLIANVEEARYQVLVADDGRLLVEARYAVRNNQRSFLKVTLPPASTVWSATVGGRPTRPGVAEANAVLLPLDKGRAGEDPPAFVVELVYFQRIEAWDKEGRAQLTLPAIDLPISRTGVNTHVSPRFRVELVPGAFRVEEDTGPFVAALRGEPMPPPPPPPPAAAPAAELQLRIETAVPKLQQLVDQFRREGRTIAGIVPVRMTFPAFGPSIFLQSELTAESQAPVIELAFKQRSGL